MISESAATAVIPGRTENPNLFSRSYLAMAEAADEEGDEEEATNERFFTVSCWEFSP